MVLNSYYCLYVNFAEFCKCSQTPLRYLLFINPSEKNFKHLPNQPIKLNNEHFLCTIFASIFISTVFISVYIAWQSYWLCFIHIYSCVVYDQTTFECFDLIVWPISPLICETVGEDNHIYSCSWIKLPFKTAQSYWFQCIKF